MLRHCLTSSVIVVLFTLSSGESLGPPPGAAGSYDFRYPDEIVQPLPECLTDGVFPHPINCTWYYRCFDRLGLGLYWRAYFKCEPGTVFSDELDQCIFPHDVLPPCGYKSAKPFPPLPSPPPTVPPIPIPQPDVCTEALIGCQEFKVCYNEGPEEIRNLCSKAYQECSPSNRITHYCQQQQYYDRNQRICVPNPNTNECIKQSVNITFHTQKELHCAADNIRPNEDWIDQQHCDNFILCLPDGRFKGTKRLCEVYYECVLKPSSKWGHVVRSCDPGSLFSYATDHCVDAPSGNELCRK